MLATFIVMLVRFATNIDLVNNTIAKNNAQIRSLFLSCIYVTNQLHLFSTMQVQQMRFLRVA